MFDISAVDIVGVARAVAEERLATRWQKVEEPRLFDVQVMWSLTGGVSERHVGIYMSPEIMLHSERLIGSCLVHKDDRRVAGKMIAAYRHRELV